MQTLLALLFTILLLTTRNWNKAMRSSAMIANILYQKEISRRMQSLYPLHSSVVSVPFVPPCEALKTPKMVATHQYLTSNLRSAGLLIL